jgi:hypothetical protein
MAMSAPVRKLALTTHVTCSVGWFGAVAGFLVVAVVGLSTPDSQRIWAAYLAADWITQFAIVPLCVASLLTGVIQSLGTTWGLFRHYWVLLKLSLTFGSTLVLLAHTRVIHRAASIATEVASQGADFHGLRVQLIADAGAALLVLLVTTALSVYKPRGMTLYGRRKQNAPAASSA